MLALHQVIVRQFLHQLLVAVMGVESFLCCVGCTCIGRTPGRYVYTTGWWMKALAHFANVSSDGSNIKDAVKTWGMGLLVGAPCELVLTWEIHLLTLFLY